MYIANADFIFWSVNIGLAVIAAHFWSKWKLVDFYVAFLICSVVTPIIGSAFLMTRDKGRFFPSSHSGIYFPTIKTNMKMPSFKKARIAGAIIVVLLMLTNPTLKDFHEYNESNNYGRRKLNFFLFSIYDADGDNYIGVLKNFIKV